MVETSDAYNGGVERGTTVIIEFSWTGILGRHSRDSGSPCACTVLKQKVSSKTMELTGTGLYYTRRGADAADAGRSRTMTRRQ